MSKENPLSTKVEVPDFDVKVIAEVYKKGFGVKAIARGVPYREKVIKGVLEEAGERIRSRGKEASRAAWKARKDALVAKVHTPQSDFKRSQTSSAKHAEDPNILTSRLEKARKALQDKTAEAKRKAYGEDPKALLTELAVTQGLLAGEIARKIGRPKQEVRKKMKEVEVPARKPRIDREILISIQKKYNEGLFGQLSDLEAQVLHGRYIDPAQMSLRQMAEKLKISHETVRTIETSALGKLGI